MIPQFTTPLTHAERKRFARLLPLLCRPELDGKLQDQLRRFVRDRLPEPLPLLPSLFPLEPLFRHHAIQAGVEAEEVFRSGPYWTPPDFQDIAKAYYDRLTVMHNLASAFRERRVEQAMIVKGSALAEAYPSPALRYMCDIDLVVSPQERTCCEQAIQDLGLWRVQNMNGIGWKWDEDGKLDFQLLHSELAREVMEHSVPPPAWMKGIPKGFRVPSLPYHLLIVALHSAHHRGTRLWRDICDALALLEHQSDGLHEAVAIARRHEMVPMSRRGEVLPHLLAFCDFMRRSVGDTRSPALDRQDMTTEEARRTAASLALYEKMAFEPAPPVFLNVLRATWNLPRQVIHPRTFLKNFVLPRALSSSQPWPGASTGKVDPILGSVPDSRGPAENFRRLGLYAGLWLFRGGRHYRQLLHLDRQVRTLAPLFIPPRY